MLKDISRSSENFIKTLCIWVSVYKSAKECV